MKVSLKVLALGVAIAASSSLAHADSITGGMSLSGYASFTPSTVNISTSQVGAAGDTGSAGLSGTFATYLTDGLPVFFATGDLPYMQGQNAVVPPFDLFFINGSGGERFDFFISSYFATYTPAGTPATGKYNTLSFLGTGIFTATGFSDTPGTFYLTSQYDTTTGLATTTFSGSASSSAVAPEPGSLILLSTSLLGAAGIARRRFSAKFGSSSQVA